MEKMQELLTRKDQLTAAMRMMDRNASFETEEGRVYAQTLVKLVLIEMQIEFKQKEKIAHKNRSD
ncbi:hypothetical protein [Bacillus sp. FJAT-26390]|uniref:hypothetical protein n=1 Tax=Bacillus sp. FJAT-26390 TaxID=1743142 RepID=UPI000807DF82|nr:hypothetical protein [Bacillus sp. FJAT-26390]OBZ17101.1 hypothetical protein A7975_04225 [Bacillus sp. FJAT-26390]